MAEEGRDLAAIYDAMSCGVVVRDAAGAIVFANAAAHRIFGRPPDELAGHDGGPTDTRRVREDGTAMPDDEVPNVAARDLGQPVRNVTMGLIRSDGYVRWLLIDAVPIFGSDGGVREVVSSFTDVTDRKKAEGELERQTLQDQLTGLPNRTLLVDRLDQALRSSRRFATPLALLVMDLDGFKEINDSFGHQAGDHLLREVATRIGVYADKQEPEGSHQLALLAELRHTLETNRLLVMYQPIVAFKAGEVTRVEALARWRHPRRGLVAPGEFIPLAERSGLAKTLFSRVLHTTLAQCAAWREAKIPLQAAVNLSIRNLLDPELPLTVKNALAQAGTPPECLGLELTETMLMAEPTLVMRTLDELRTIGVQIAIDDFGVGYSSLAYLQRLPVQSVKIDQSFVGRLTKDRGTAEIVKAIANLGHALGMSVVAEGIEDRDTFEACAAVGCDSAQGYFLGRPMVASAIPAWLALGNRSATTIS